MNNNFIRDVNTKAKDIMMKCNIGDSTEPLVTHRPTIKIKDHKENLITKPTLDWYAQIAQI